ncbi:hypothetical protein [Prosthecobacter dejongeii]|uniref:Uncharacterized protein n=1 Tax=Prosthecobacter dejongeii TaxID=48465 RepID=A0A7W7YL82_9BACT|nr:hypothetical protein [Prosthecobacter dejongeii]MBB5038266.1 hypothetical protein [Prosthecobacter dejongeii]
MSASANTILITETRLAACFRALGFPYQAEVIIHERRDEMRVQFLFQPQSLRFPSLFASALLAQWQSGELAQREPLHLLCVMMNAQHNYDQLLKAQKQGSALRVVSVAGGLMTRYVLGQEPATVAFSPERVSIDDLRLAACLGMLGVPLLRITGSSPRHVFEMARTGYPVLLSDGQRHVHDAQVLSRRSPTEADPLRLWLEIQQPLHPLCIGYDALYSRTQLKRELETQKKLLMIDEASHRVTGDGASTEILAAKQALVSVDAAGHVMDHVTRHMKSPPIFWTK